MSWLTRKEVKDVLVVLWRAVVAALLGLIVGNGGLAPAPDAVAVVQQEVR